MTGVPPRAGSRWISGLFLAFILAVMQLSSAPAGWTAAVSARAELEAARGLTCQGATRRVKDAKRAVSNARQALRGADTPRESKRAKRKLKSAKRALAEAEEDKAAACAPRFAVVGAQGKGNTGQTEVAAAIDEKCELSGCDYLIGLGNNIYESGASSTADPKFNELFETPYAGIDLPFWLGLGNHDYGGDGAGNETAKAQTQVDYTAVSPSGNWKMPAHYYRRSDQNVEFFTLDTTPQMFGTDTQQETDVAAWLDESNAEWKIALGLHSYRSNGAHGNAGSYDDVPFTPIVNGAGVRDFMEDHVCGEVDVYFSAHDHNLQWLQQDATNCPGTELIVSGAGASTTALTRSNPTHFESATLGFAYVVIEGREMTVDFVDTEGTSLFSRTISK